MSASSPHGHFVWHDLITTDVPAGIEFYKKVIGWNTQPFDPEGRYMMWTGKSGPIGGIGAANAGVAPYWRAYIGTDDIEATVYEAQQLGGTVVSAITDVPNVGRWAALRDPQGNEFGVFWAADTKAPEFTMQPGEIHWHELATDDYKSAFTFYQKLFGWEPGMEHSMGAIGTYALFKNEDRPQGMGGFYNKQPGTAGGWCAFTIVKDVKKAAVLISKLGGTNIHEPIKVLGGSWVIKFTDPQGVMHALTSTGDSDKQSSKRKPVAKTNAKKPAAKSSKPSAKKSVKKKVAKKSTKKKATKKPVKTVAKKKKVAAKKSVKKVLKKSSGKKALKKTTGKKAKKTVKAKKKK